MQCHLSKMLISIFTMFFPLQELRFILFSVPMLNVSAASAMARMYVQDPPYIVFSVYPLYANGSICQLRVVRQFKVCLRPSISNAPQLFSSILKVVHVLHSSIASVDKTNKFHSILHDYSPHGNFFWVVDHKDKPWIVNADTTTSQSQSGHLLMQHVLYF